MGEDFAFWLAYLTNGKHLAFYASFRFTILAAVFGALLALVFGLLGAMARNSRFAPLRWLGTIYIMMVRGIPDVLFFLFFPLAFEQSVEWALSLSVCSAEARAGSAWPPCPAANLFFSTTEYLILACVSLGIIFGAFTANVIHGAMRAVPRGQLEAGRAYGMSEFQVLTRIHVRQMWIYALPGLSNVWLLLIKATSLLSLLQINDIVWWAGQLGSPNFLPQAGLVHGDWRWAYYTVLFVFYIFVTLGSEQVFRRLTAWARRGMPLEA
ncbi:ABC transporter permease [Pelagibacterium xiamenense]|uniref:ABC transporter permease n=1 Tax=Pelagibacterium xiamenense TaxID=2901140 RepID=UPI001E351F42|nr:ABC transporter permease subunit [Pelagibacterium xiamenense]MCD7060397.1 ABC transporter permease subunit [Pelagibacterium xiamenense]